MRPSIVQQRQHQAASLAAWQAKQLMGIQQMCGTPSGLTGFGFKPDSQTKEEKRTMMKEIKEDMKKFIREHKSLIYWTVGLILLDRFYFNGAFEKKLKEMMQRLVSLVEKKFDSVVPAVGASDEKRS